MNPDHAEKRSLTADDGGSKARAETIPQGFVQRMTSSLLLLFLVTMTGFIWIAYRAERDTHNRERLNRLADTARVIALFPGLGSQDSADDLKQLERLLDTDRGVRHRILITDSSSIVIAASESDSLGRDFRTLFDLVPVESAPVDTGRKIQTSPEGDRWLVVSVPLGSGGDRLHVIRIQIGRDEFADRFLQIHALHTVVTLLLFLVLLRFLGRRFIQRPIEQLARHVHRIESGEFQTQPEIYRDDEFGWLADRFSRMGQRLSETVQQQVRSEKAATAAAMAYRVVRESAEPLHDLDRHITYLEGIVAGDRDLGDVARSIRDDHQRLVRAAGRLESAGQEADELVAPSPTDSDAPQE